MSQCDSVLLIPRGAIQLIKFTRLRHTFWNEQFFLEKLRDYLFQDVCHRRPFSFTFSPFSSLPSLVHLLLRFAILGDRYLSFLTLTLNENLSQRNLRQAVSRIQPSGPSGPSVSGVPISARGCPIRILTLFPNDSDILVVSRIATLDGRFHLTTSEYLDQPIQSG